MLDTDKKLFSDYLILCFQNYRANISDDMIEQWFRSKLYSFPLYVVMKSLEAYADNAKNKYPPQRAQLIQLCYEHTNGAIQKNKIDLGCSNMLGGMNCGKQIFVHSLCEKCYDLKRPKSFVDQKREEALKAFYERAEKSGAVTEREIADFARAEMSLKPLGRLFLKHTNENGHTSSVAIDNSYPQQ